MGLDAFVNCNCFKEGKTSKPPVDSRLIVFDDGLCDVTLPDEGNQKIIKKFYHWIKNCCPHPNMQFLSVYVSNWWGVRTFQEALGKIGWEHFPVLKAGLPEGNGGSVPASSSEKALDELNYFERNVHHLKNIYLVESKTGEPIYNYVRCYDGTFFLAGYQAGSDEKGFFVVKKNGDQDEELFRATRFTQKVTQRIFSKKVKAGWVNVENQSSFTADMAIKVDRGYPDLLHVEWRNEDSSDYQYVLEPLKQIFEASRATGNPVYWA